MFIDHITGMIGTILFGTGAIVFFRDINSWPEAIILIACGAVLLVIVIKGHLPDRRR